ncbi:MAG: hypothetical protein NVSMB9_15310 [Isosphaeraceae bacterium]
MSRNDRTRAFVRLALGALLPLLVCLGAAGESPVTDEQLRFFEAKVRPVLVDNCWKCHGPEKQKAGLRLDSRAGVLGGGEQGPAIVPGKPAESLLVKAVEHVDDALKMPPTKKLRPEQVADLTRWVTMGAPWPGDEVVAPSSIRKAGYQITDKDRAHWAFRPVRRPPVPESLGQSWVKNPIDAFLLARLKSRGLRPNPPASRVEWIRRLSYDLTGLPPTPGEVEAFVNDPAPDADEKLVDRLLDSPRHGEKWGRHWLDLVRFAETNSYERDNPKPNAWRFRDYVIRSFNQDKPYDQFIREQLAGDESAPDDPDALAATGYYRLGIWDDEPTDRDQARYDSFDDIVATTAQVFLGLTVDCARCHDHKIDPIPQKDYYKLVAFFRNIKHFRNGGPTDEAPLFARASDRGVYEARLRERRRRLDEIQQSLSATEKDFLAKLDPSQAENARPRDIDGLRYRFYRDTFDRLPDFDSLKPEESGDLPEGRFSLAPRSRDDAFGFVFEGTLIVPETGTYTFILTSDNGARITVGGKTVIESDGIQSVGTERRTTVELPQGRWPIRLDYFQTDEQLVLNVAWSGPGFNRRALSTGEKEMPLVDLPRLIQEKGEKILGPERFRWYERQREELKTLAIVKP